VFSCRSGKEEKKTKFCLKNSRKLKIYKTNTPQKFLTNKCKMMYIRIKMANNMMKTTTEQINKIFSFLIFFFFMHQYDTTNYCIVWENLLDTRGKR
jgi:hypothetical protein